MKLIIYKDFIDTDGTIISGPQVAEFDIITIKEVLIILKHEYPGYQWNPCSDGSDGMYESSSGSFGDCYVSNIIKTCI